MDESQKLAIGVRVKTQKPHEESDDWTKDALESRKWDMLGEIISHHDAHGFTYEVKHEDGTIGHYEPRELKLIK